MSTWKTTRLALALGLLALAASPLAAQSHPNRTKGFDPRGTYSIGDVDTVNLFNGALTVTIPLGPRFPVGSSDYGFALVYNSNAWTVREVCPPEGGTSPISFSSSLELSCIPHDSDGDGDSDFTVCEVGRFGGGWSPPGDSFDPRPATGCYNLARPNPTTNAGLGWQLNLGKLLPPMAANDDRSPFVVEAAGWNYAGSDGALHALGGEPGGVHYTHDGSFLRRKDCPGSGETCQRVEFPDGGVETHELVEQAGEWRLTKRVDAFGNGFTITYFSGLSWEIKDTEQRVHLVTLEQPDPEFPAHISLLRLDVHGPRPLEVDLVHDPEPLNRAAPHNDTGIGGPPISPRIAAQFLQQIDFKSNGALVSQWSFGSATEAYAIDQPATARINGVLKRLRMPTGATLEWSWGGGYTFPTGSSGRSHLRSSPGVRSRTVTDVTGSAIGTWSYAPELEDRPEDSECQVGNNLPWLAKCHEKQITNTVTAPGGYRTKHYFSVYPLPPYLEDPEGWDGLDYGLPFTRKQGTSVELAGETLYLSTETFEPGAPDSAPLRKSYVRYERDEPSNPLEWDGFHSEILNSERVAARAEVFEDDTRPGSGKHWRLTTSERWDGHGHYKDQIVRSSFPGEENRARKVTTDYPGVRPAVSAPWFLGKYTKVVTADLNPAPGVLGVTVREVCFHPSKPVIERARSLAGASPGPNDILAVVTFNDVGQVTEERLFGGDGAGLGTGALCNVAIPATPTARTVHDYVKGVRSTSVVKDPCSGVEVVKLLDQDIDRTGMPEKVRDSAGIGVTLTYDALGRRIEETPDAGHGARTVYEYRVPGIRNLPGTDPVVHPSNQEAQVIVKRLSGGGAQLAVSEVYFDGLGRAIADSTWMPKANGGTGVALTWSKLTAQGWKNRVSMPRCGGPATDLTAACGGHGTSSSEPGLDALPPAEDYPQDHQGVTRYELYDPFGRPGRIVAPDGFVSTATYTGVREVERKVKVGTAVGVLSDAKRTERYDSLGRLAAVVEKSGPGDVTTSYGYDVGDRLVSVSTSVPNGPTQTRRFVYDGRGFLTSETHPELGETGNGTKQYSDHDARGLAGHSAILLDSGDPDADRALDYRYDAAGRLIEIKNAGRPLEQFFYGWANGPAGFSAGKIVEARRFNVGSGVTVSESYEYQGRAGRVSKKTTRTSLGHRFETAATYNLLGDVETVSYPTCSGLVGCDSVDDPRTVTYSYDLGFLKTVGESGLATKWLTATTYAPSGRWHTLRRPNGTTDVQAGDPKGLGRPQSLTTTGPAGTLLWETGPGGYTYDGAGNITGMGPERFTYDLVSRLKSGTVKTLPLATTTGASETLGYDAFGNQLSRVVTGATSSPAPPVSSATNRLTGEGVTYDANGNLVQQGSSSYGFDALNTLSFLQQGSQTTHYLYAPGGERIATLRQGGVTTWTLRGFGNEVLRVFEQDAADTWRRRRDYLFRGGQLLASESPQSEGVSHYHLDHLGSTRLVTGSAGEYRGFHAYLPFGEEVTPPANSATQLKYTGHERDEGMSSTSRADDMDYMHARWAPAGGGRFLSVDPVLGRVGAPQSWNRYAYAFQNPLIVVDPTGRAGVYVVNAFQPSEFSSAKVTDYFDFWSVYQTGDAATSKNFTTALRDAGGLTIFIGHSDLEDTLFFQSRTQSVNFEKIAQTPPGIANKIVCLATCNSTAILDGLKTRPGQAFVGVTSNRTWQGTSGYVQAGDLAYIAAQFVEKLRNGMTVGEISEALNKELAERSKANPNYRVTVVVYGDKNARLELSGAQP